MTDIKWYEYDIKDRYENVYKKFSILDFYNWWSDKNEDEYMEIRFQKWQHAELCQQKFNLYKHKNSVFINKDWQLKNIVGYFRDKSTLWFGINPRRKLRNQYGNFVFSGKDINVSKIKYVFIDIDRVIKDGPATSNDLMNADFLANKILSELSKEGFNKNYIKICSGNGLQLLFKLDVPIEIPQPTYDPDNKIYMEDELFINRKNVLKKGIGQVLQSFSNHFKNTYNVEIDRTVFNIGRVGALPYSYNLKYEQPIPRGIIEFENSNINNGLSDYIMNLYESQELKQDIKSNYNKISTEKNSLLLLNKEYNILKNDLSKNKIINLMLNYTFPDGGINNTLWYAIKILLHRNDITNQNKEYKKIHELLKKIHNRSFSDNGLEPQYKNNYNGSIKENALEFVPLMVNKYLRLHKIQNIKTQKIGYHKPLFSVSPFGKNVYDIKVNISPKCIDTQLKKTVVI